MEFFFFSLCPWKMLSEALLTFKPMTEDVLQDGNKVNELWRRVIYCFETGAIQQGLHGKSKPTNETDNLITFIF